MIAPTSTRTDFGALDERIARALDVLRLARAAAARGSASDRSAAEVRAEADLNGLLEYRHATRLRSAS